MFADDFYVYRRIKTIFKGFFVLSVSQGIISPFKSTGFYTTARIGLAIKLALGFFDKGSERFERLDTYMVLDTFGIEFCRAR